MRSRHVHLKLKRLVPGTLRNTPYCKLSLGGTKLLNIHRQENELLLGFFTAARRRQPGGSRALWSRARATRGGSAQGSVPVPVPVPAREVRGAASPAPGRRGDRPAGASARGHHGAELPPAAPTRLWEPKHGHIVHTCSVSEPPRSEGRVCRRRGPAGRITAPSTHARSELWRAGHVRSLDTKTCRAVH